MEEIIDKRIQFGKAQYLPFMFLCLVDLNDGVQLVLSSFITPLVQFQWGLSSAQTSTLSSIFYLGILLGSLISGALSDKFGRKIILTIGSSLQLITSILFVIVHGFQSMLFIRFVYGFSFGFTIVLTTSMLAEISPSEYRGKGLLLLNFGISVGKFYAVGLAYICLENFHVGNWKLMMFLSAIPNIFVLYGAFTVIYQSPRFLAANRRFQQAYQTLQKMIEMNHPNCENNKLTSQQRQRIQLWQHQIFSEQKTTLFKSLFSEQYLRTTICLGIGWFAINFMYYGQLISLPFIYGKQEKTFSSYAFTIAGQLPSLLLSLYIIDKPNFGRKNSLIYFFILSSFCNVSFALFPITFLSSLTRFFMKQCFQMLYPFTTESFGTLNRTLGFGFCSSIGRLGSTIMPYLVVPLVEINPNLIFYVLALFGFFGTIATYMTLRQSLNQPLDVKFTPLIAVQNNQD